MRAHRGGRKTWELPTVFPSSVVVDAYLRPRVDHNKARFAWGRPDLDSLRGFCRWEGAVS